MDVLLARGAALLAGFSAVWLVGCPAVDATPIGALVASRTGEALGPAAVSGDDVFVGAPDATLHVQDQGAVFVFARPAAGWSGTLRAPEFVHALTDADGETSLALDQRVLFAGRQDIAMNSETNLELFDVPRPSTRHGPVSQARLAPNCAAWL